MMRRGTIRAFTLWGTTPAEEREIHAALVGGLESGTMRPVVGKELPLAQAAQAHTEVMAPGAFGKIVLIP
jgi:NADPH2:quinone reductase